MIVADPVMEKLAIGDPVGNAFQSRARNDLNRIMTLGTIGLEQELAILGQGPGGWEKYEEDEEQRVYLSGHVVVYGKIMPRQIKTAGQSYPAVQADV